MAPWNKNNYTSIFREVYADWLIDENLLREIDWHIFLLSGISVDKDLLREYLMGNEEAIKKLDKQLGGKLVESCYAEITGNIPEVAAEKITRHVSNWSRKRGKKIDIEELVDTEISFKGNGKPKNNKLPSLFIPNKGKKGHKHRGKAKLFNNKGRGRR